MNLAVILIAIIGAARSAVSVAVSHLSTGLNALQISYWSTSPELNDKQAYPNFGRTIPDDSTLTISPLAAHI